MWCAACAIMGTTRVTPASQLSYHLRRHFASETHKRESLALAKLSNITWGAVAGVAIGEESTTVRDSRPLHICWRMQPVGMERWRCWRRSWRRQAFRPTASSLLPQAVCHFAALWNAPCEAGDHQKTVGSALTSKCGSCCLQKAPAVAFGLDETTDALSRNALQVTAYLPTC